MKGKQYKIKRKDAGCNCEEKFDFLGFTHFIYKTCKGKFKVEIKTRRKKFNLSLKKMNSWLKVIRNRNKTKE